VKIFKDKDKGRPVSSVARFARGALEEFAPAPPVEVAGLEAYEEPVYAPELTAADLEGLREEVLAEAQAEAEAIREQAREAGFREGEAEGRAAFDEAAGACLDAIREATARMEERHAAFVAETKPQMLAFLRHIAKRLLHREAETDPELIARTVEGALGLIGEAQSVTITLNPEDLAYLREHTATLLETYPGIAAVRCQPDPNIARGGALLDTETLHIDAQLEQLVSELFAVLEE